MLDWSEEIYCPYCFKNLVVGFPTDEGSYKIICDGCKKKLALHVMKTFAFATEKIEAE